MLAKQELIDQLYMLKGFYRLGLATTILLSHQSAPEILRTSHVMVNNREKLTFEYLVKYLQDPATKNDVLQENNNIYLRAILLNSFELLKDYCNENGKFDLMKRQPWYEIIRIIRNGLGHDLRHDLSNYPDSAFPMQIRAYTITKDMHDKPIKLDSVQGYNFSLDMILFAKQYL